MTRPVRRRLQAGPALPVRPALSLVGAIIVGVDEGVSGRAPVHTPSFALAEQAGPVSVTYEALAAIGEHLEREGGVGVTVHDGPFVVSSVVVEIEVVVIDGSVTTGAARVTWTPQGPRV